MGDRDRRRFRELLSDLAQRFDARVLAYVLMDNHYHLMLETRKANLSQTMQWLQVSYSVWFNRRHRRVGHLFEGRFTARVVEPDAWGLAVSRYVHLNPVRVDALGLGKKARAAQRLGVDSAPRREEIRERIQRLRGYRWSSYRAYAGFESGPAWLESRPVLGRTGPSAEREQRAWYRQYVEQAVREGLAECPWESLTAQVALGSAEFVRLLRSNLRGDAKEQPSLRALARDVTWERVVHALERVRGEAWSDFRDRHGDWGRDLVLYVARRRAGMTLKGLGQAVGGLDYRSVGWAVQRMEERLQGDRFLGQKLKELDAHIQNPET